MTPPMSGPTTEASRDEVLFWLLGHADPDMTAGDLRGAVERLEALARADADAQTQVVLAKYGLESMAGNPAEILDRHLTNNRAATEGFYKLALDTTASQIAVLREALERLERASSRMQHRTEALNVAESSAAMILSDTAAAAQVF